MRGQFTRIAKQAALHLQALKVAVKAELDEAMTARNWSAVARLRKTFVTIDRLINDEYELMSKALKKELGDLFVYESEFTSKLLGFDFTSSLVTEKLVDSIVSNDPFDGKILGEWLDEQKLATQIKVKQTIRLGVLNGLSTSKIVDALYAEPGNPFLGAKRNAEVMVRTASAHVTSQASLKTFERVGFGSYQLSAVLDSRTTPVCRALDGKVYKVTDKGRKVPPFHPGCRTVMIAVSDDEPAFTDGYEDWLGRQDAAEQEAILGPARYRLWKAGQTLESFVDLDTHHVIPLDQLRLQESLS
ncbi:minor capsid protein [Pseudomonas plecoglossicida]|uniref:minor capsid protein n=1 Tax=Pseudomonas putida group TaxID=136845 RepID=UPI00240F6C13|nr:MULTISPECIES: minor capsid protein [Pseudomonas putida group]MDQ7967733.1 minor capsid protein [Pseudomonas plecoglossicida]WFG05295.1 minor capsid protein [Pseudomonas putida]